MGAGQDSRTSTRYSSLAGGNILDDQPELAGCSQIKSYHLRVLADAGDKPVIRWSNSRCNQT